MWRTSACMCLHLGKSRLVGIELPYEIWAFLGSASQRVAAGSAAAAAVDDHDESPFNVGAGQLAQEAMDERCRKGERERERAERKNRVL